MIRRVGLIDRFRAIRIHCDRHPNGAITRLGGRQQAAGAEEERGGGWKKLIETCGGPKFTKAKKARKPAFYLLTREMRSGLKWGEVD